MKISNSWLRQYFNAEISTKEISEILTNTGLEIGGLETVETFPGGLKGLVIGEILTKEKHPNADRLNVTTVNIGNDEPIEHRLRSTKCSSWSKSGKWQLLVPPCILQMVNLSKSKKEKYGGKLP